MSGPNQCLSPLYILAIYLFDDPFYIFAGTNMRGTSLCFLEFTSEIQGNRHLFLGRLKDS